MNEDISVERERSYDESYDPASPSETLLASEDEYYNNNESMQQLDYQAIGEKYEVKFHQLMIRELIGQGYYSDVHFGTLALAVGKIPVAVKSPKSFTKAINEQEREFILRHQRKALRSELEILIDLQTSGGHQNVLKLVGSITTLRTDFCIMTEFCEWGSMDNFLKKKFMNGEFEDEIIVNDDEQEQIWKIDRDSSWEETFEARRESGIITTSDLLWFALQIARAMQFLTSKNIVHRDAALRNVLLKPDFTIKISDFGLSKKLKEGNEAYYVWNKRSALPIRYIAPESLSSGRFTIHSEFWSFGVVLWELFTFSQTQPYSTEFENSNNTDFFDFIIEHLSAENRLIVPTIAPISTQKLIASLWHKDLAQRPSFGACQDILKQQLKRSCPQILINDKTVRLNASENSIFDLKEAEVNEKTALHRTSSQVAVPYFETMLTAGRSTVEVNITRRKTAFAFVLVVLFIIIAIATSFALYNILNLSNNLKNQDFVSKIIKDDYKKRLKSYNPLYSFLDFQFDMKDGYVPLTLHSRTFNEDISDLDVFIEKAFSDFRLTIVVGDPGSGKTTLLRKIAFDWANIGRFQKYDIILFSEFRLLPDGNYKSILDLALAGVSEIDLSKNINISGKRVLILIDGYDEKRQKHTCNQLDKMMNNNETAALEFDLLITSRPSSIFKRKKEASLWEINGFMSDEQQNNYIRNHFRNAPETSQKWSKIESDLENNYSLRQLAKSPMMLSFFCLVHDKMEQITKAALFDAVVKFMIQRLDKKYPEKKILHELAKNAMKLPIELTDQKAIEAVEQWREFSQMKRLGKLAFEATLQKKLVFQSNEFGTGDSAINIAVFEDCGLLFKKSQINGISPSYEYQFVHRTIQEFFSALYFLYWETDTVQYTETLLDRNRSGSIKSDHTDFVQMTFDVLMAERKESALISIAPLLSEIQYLHFFGGPTIRLQSESVDELRKEHTFFQSIMRNYKKIRSIDIDGMGAAVDFVWTIKLPDDHHGGKITVFLKNFNFVGTNKSILSVTCSEHVQFERFWLSGSKFEPERLRLTVDGHLSQMESVIINLTPEMMGKLSILPDSSFTPSFFSGTLSLWFPVRSELRSNFSTQSLNKTSTLQNCSSLFIDEKNNECEERATYGMLLMFPNIFELYLVVPSFQYYNGSELQKFKNSLAQRFGQIPVQTQSVDETLTIN